MSMIEAELSLLDVEVEELTGQTSVFGQAGFRVAPERLDSIDVACPSGKFVLAVVDSEVALVTDIVEP